MGNITTHQIKSNDIAAVTNGNAITVRVWSTNQASFGVFKNKDRFIQILSQQKSPLRGFLALPIPGLISLIRRKTGSKLRFHPRNRQRYQTNLQCL